MDERDLFYERMVAGADWHDTANSYETDRRLHYVFEILLQNASLEGARFLDGGSGGGHFSAEAVRRGAQVTSVDVGTNLLSQVAERCESFRVVGSVLELPFLDGSFDIVMSTEVIEHTPDPHQGLREFARVLRPGGTLVVTTPCRLWQPVVRAASTLKLRPFQGRENFIWPRLACRELQASGVDIEAIFGFNLLPLFFRPLERLHRWADRAGHLCPSLYVNFGIRGAKRVVGA